MKILELRLLVFGPFTEAFLDLSERKQGFHIVFGPNEAGKSSALRALKALLYGIPNNTTDNFIHNNNTLRVGCRICHSDGTDLSFLRRKGHKNTLLGLDEKPLDDSVLGKFLSGVGEQLFFTVFGIDHAALVRGGEDILQGGGDVGQSLFTAGLGGASVRKILQKLDAEANELFRQRGQVQVINKAISEYSEAKRKISETSLPGSEWPAHDTALKEAITERQNVREKLRHLQGDANRLKHLQVTIPKIAKRRELVSKGVWPSLKYRLRLVVAFLREPPHALDHRGVWHRVHRDRVFEKAVEEFAAMA